MNLDYLDKIKKVEAPPFLFTRIKQKIKNSNTLSKKSVWGLVLSFVLLLVVNIGLIIKNQTDSFRMDEYAKKINLYSNNNLYK